MIAGKILLLKAERFSAEPEQMGGFSSFLFSFFAGIRTAQSSLITTLLQANNYNIL